MTTSDGGPARFAEDAAVDLCSGRPRQVAEAPVDGAAPAGSVRSFVDAAN